jgi:4a-hydroxytetrahydrobiopterin dehydratase
VGEIFIGNNMRKFTESKKQESWIEKDSLIKNFEFKDYSQALKFINDISLESEKLNHHADVNWQFNKIELRLKTHDKSKITELDYKLSKEIDKIYKKFNNE